MKDLIVTVDTIIGGHVYAAHPEPQRVLNRDAEYILGRGNGFKPGEPATKKKSRPLTNQSLVDDPSESETSSYAPPAPPLPKKSAPKPKGRRQKPSAR